MPSHARASIVFAALFVAGCSASVADDVADASGGMTEGIVLVERIVSSDDTTQTYVSAKFMRLPTASEPELAERVVGSRFDLPAIGECVRVGPTSEVDEKAASLASLGSIELIDVGDVTLRTVAAVGRNATAPADAARDIVMPLATRAFPDVGDIVSGVFYTSRDAESDLPAGATYVFEGTGSAAVDRFVIEADAPVALDDVRVGDMTLVEGMTLDEGVPALVRWLAPRTTAMNDGPRDLVVIDVSGPAGSATRCAFEDDGEATIPGEILRPGVAGEAVNDGSAAGKLSSSATIAVHRIRRRPFGATGIDAGEVRFDLSILGRVAIAPRSP